MKKKEKSADISPRASKPNNMSIYWLVSLLPLLCFVGAWTKPALATPDLLKSMTAQIYLSVLLVFWLWSRRSATFINLHYTKASALFAALFVFASISVAWSVNVDFFVHQWLLWYASALMFFFILQINHSHENLNKIFNSIVIAGVIVSVIGIAQYLFLFEQLPQTTLPASTFGNGNIAAQVIVLCFPAGIYLFLKQNSQNTLNWIYAIGLTLMLAFVFYTRTRAAWIAISLEIILIALFLMLDKAQRSEWLYWDHRKTKASLSAFLLFTVLINVDNQGFQPFTQIVTSAAQQLAESVTYGGSARYWLWNSALQMIKTNPLLGTGLGSFLENFNHGYLTLGTWNIRSAHNDLLQLVVELGIFGFLIFVVLVFATIKVVFDLAHNSSGAKRLAYATTVVSLAGTSINALISFPYQVQVPFIILPLYLAILIKGKEEHTPREKLKVKKLAISNGLRITGLSAATFALIVVTTVNIQWFQLYKDLSDKVASNDPKIFKPDPLIFHKDLIPTLRSMSVSLHRQGEHNKALSLTPSLLTYWPEVTMNAILRADHYVSLKNYHEAERLVTTFGALQPKYSYFKELILVDIYRAQKKSDKLWEIYQRLASEPEESLQFMQKVYLTLHFLSVKFKDYSKTQLFYEKYLKYFTTTSELESNMVTYYMDTEQEERAVPHMIKALELNPQVHNAEAMRFFLKKYSNSL